MNATPEPALGQRTHLPPLGETEQTLAALWEALLGIAQVGRDDHFFHRGGHSLNALHFVDFAVRQGLQVSVADLLEAPILQGLAARIDAKGPSPAGGAGLQTLRPPREGAAQAPLFFVHDAAGLLLYAQLLAPHLATDAAIYGLPALGLEGATTDLIERSAARMIESILAVQPEGPYRLAGCSLGGLLAYEIASQLLARQAKVERVFLIDAPTTLSAYLPPERIARPPADQAGIRLDYQARPIDARIHLLVTLERPDAVQTVSRWSEIVPSGLLQTVMLAGHHRAMIRPPYIENLARQIDSALATPPRTR